MTPAARFSTALQGGFASLAVLQKDIKAARGQTIAFGDATGATSKRVESLRQMGRMGGAGDKATLAMLESIDSPLG